MRVPLVRAARLHLSPLTGMLLVHLVLALAPLGALAPLAALAPPLRVSKRHVACANAATRTTSAVTMSMGDGDSLTLAQLRARLRPAWHALCALAEERGITTSRTDCSAGEWASRTLLATRLERLALDRCHVCHTGLEPQTSRSQAGLLHVLTRGLLLTRASLALDRWPIARSPQPATACSRAATSRQASSLRSTLEMACASRQAQRAQSCGPYRAPTALRAAPTRRSSREARATRP